MHQPKVAIINFGMGNLFSVRNACQAAGLHAQITSNPDEILAADGVILPGVGAFAKAMSTLTQLNLIDVIHQVIADKKPFMGICLGMQLLMSESFEFGHARGLDILKGSVRSIREACQEDELKVPHIGWNRLYSRKVETWKESVFSGIEQNEFMYFVHSFFVQPEEPGIILSLTKYGNLEFCSSLSYQNIFACQFHPEKSADKGIQIYKNWAKSFN